MHYDKKYEERVWKKEEIIKKNFEIKVFIDDFIKNHKTYTLNKRNKDILYLGEDFKNNNIYFHAPLFIPINIFLFSSMFSLLLFFSFPNTFPVKIPKTETTLDSLKKQNQILQERIKILEQSQKK